MNESTDRITYDDIEGASLSDWRLLSQGLHTRYATGDFATGVRLVDAVAVAADEVNHHPDVMLTYPHVDIALVSHDAGRVTQRDLDLARTISAIAAAQGVTAEPASVQQIELALDTANRAVVQPFWRELLGYADGRDGVRDPGGRGPEVWFQEAEGERGPQRWHYDVWVPAEQVRPRIDAALAAGGKVVAEYPEHSFWVLEDAEGNRSCVCTAKGR